MGSLSPISSPPRRLLGPALCAVLLSGCAKPLQWVAPKPLSPVKLTVRARPEGVFTFAVPALDGVYRGQWLDEHHPRIAQKLTPVAIGTKQVKGISLERSQVTIITDAKDADDCERQAGRIEQVLSDLYGEVNHLAATIREASPSDLDAIKQVIEARSEAAGLSDLTVLLKAPDSLSMEFMCADNPESARELLTARGLLEVRLVPRQYAHGGDRVPTVATEAAKTVFTFRDEHDTAVDVANVIAESPVIVSGADFRPVSRVIALSDHPTGVTFELRKEIGEEFEAFTRAHVDRYLAVVFDGELITCPIIRSTVPGEGIIEGGFDDPGGMDSARKLAILINSRPLPLDIECVESTADELSP